MVDQTERVDGEFELLVGRFGRQLSEIDRTPASPMATFIALPRIKKAQMMPIYLPA